MDCTQYKVREVEPSIFNFGNRAGSPLRALLSRRLPSERSWARRMSTSSGQLFASQRIDLLMQLVDFHFHLEVNFGGVCGGNTIFSRLSVLRHHDDWSLEGG